MTEEQEQLLKDVHACLVGEKLKGQRGLIDRVGICENELHTLKAEVDKKSNKWDLGKIFKLLKIVKTV